MASNFNGAAAWAEREAQKSKGFDGATAWAERESAKAKEQSLAYTANTTNRMLAGSDIMGRVTPPVETKPTRTGDEIRTELSAVQDELAGTYGTANPFNSAAVAQKQEELKAQEKALKAELEAVEPTFGQKVGLALKSIGNANVGSLWSLGETAVQGAKNTVEEFQNEEYRTTLGDLTAAKEKLRFAERSKNMSAKAMSDYEAALAEVNRLQAKLDSLQVKTSVGADSLGQQTLAKANDQKEAALQGTEGVGRWVGENLIGVAQNASMLPLAAVNPTLPAVAMGTIAAGSKAAELNAQGVAPGEALIRGGVSGGIEALTEKIPLDSILDMVKVGGKSAIKNLLKQAGTEAGEESISYVLNYIADKAAGDPNATFDLKELSNAAASGAFSGGIMGGGATLIGNALNPAENKNTAPPDGSTAEYRADIPQNVEYPTVPIINLSVKSFADANGAIPKTGNALRADAIQNARTRLGLDKNSAAYIPASNVRRNGEEYVLKITPSSLRKMLNPANGGTLPVESIAVLNNIERIANNGVYFRSEGDRSGRPQINGFDHLMTTVYIDGAPTVVDMRVKLVQQERNGETDNVLYYFTPDVITITKENDATPVPERQALRDEVSPFLGDSVADSEPVVNTPPVAPKTEPVMPPVFKDGKVVNPDDSVGAAPTGFDPFSDSSLKYGAIEPGENPARVVDVPISTDGENRTSRTARTVMEAEATPDEVLGDIADRVMSGKDGLTYIPITNDATTKRAEASIKENGYEASLLNWSKRVASGNVSADLTAMGALLYNAAVNSGNTKQALDILSDYATMVRSGAQAVQAARILKTLTPEGKLYYAQKSVQRIQEELDQKFGEGKYNITIPDSLANAYLNAETEEARNAALDAIYKDVAKQIPATLAEKWNAWRYLSMLGNPRTHIRNIFGNALFAPFRVVKNAIATAGEGVSNYLSPNGIERTKASLNYANEADRALVKAAFKDSANVQDQLLGHGKYDTPTGIIEKNKRIFSLGPVEAVRKANESALNAEDAIFSKTAYAGALAGYLKANGVTAEQFAEMQKNAKKSAAVVENTKPKEIFKPGTTVKALDRDNYGKVVSYNASNNTYSVHFVSPNGSEATVSLPASQVFAKGQKPSTVGGKKLLESGNANGFIDAARAYAIKEAQKATYRDANALSDFVAGLHFNGNNIVGKGANILLEGVLPFRRTPANILARGLEYSPAGLVKGLTYDLAKVKSGDMTAAEAIDNISAGLTGTGLVALGYFLAQSGLISGGGSGNEEKDQMEDLMGGQNYAMSVGDKNYTLDWLAPEAMPFFVGVELFNLLTDKTDGSGRALNDITEALKSISEPMMEMSMLSGVQDLLESISYSDKPIWGIISSAATNYATQLIPTILGQIERIGENERQTTYINRDGILTNNLQYTIGKAMNKTPGEFSQIPYIDAWGRTEDSGTTGDKVVNNMLAPYYSSERVETEADKEIMRLLDAGYTGVAPDRVKQSYEVTYKDNPEDKDAPNQSRYMTADEYVEFSKIKGQTSLDIVSEMIGTDLYSKMTDEEKANAIKLAYEYANHIASSEITDGKHVMDKKHELAQTADKELGVSAAEYLLLCEKYGTESVNGDNVRKAYNDGMEVEDFLSYTTGKKAYNTDGKQGYTTKETSAAIKDSGLSRDEQTTLWLIENPEWGEKAADAGVSASVYVDFKVATIGKSKKEDILKAINRMGISKAQKDKLYYAAGYAESKIAEAPWR